MTIKLDVWDALALVGGVLLLLGLAWAWPPLALIGIGAGFLGVGIMGALRWDSLRAYSGRSKKVPADEPSDEV